jgi:phosphatidylglycerol:prolipoprotein diacylglycerol transferase
MSYFIWYSIGRFFVEGVRTDSLAFNGPSWLASFMRVLWSPMKLLFEEGSMAYGNVRVSQLLGVIIIIVAVGLIVYRRKTVVANVRYVEPIVSSKTVETQVSVEHLLH